MTNKSKPVIASFSYPSDEIPLMGELEKIADRERRSNSYMIVEAIREYVKAHGKANANYPLDAWEDAPEVKAYPTAWKTLGRSDLEGYEEKELEEMRTLLERNMKTIDNIIRIPVPTKDTGRPRS